jgi:lysophospholipase L1-like esterase
MPHFPTSIAARTKACFVSIRLAAALLLMACACSEDAFRVPDPAVQYVAFGDSATAGPAERDYVDYLPQRLDEPPEAFANEGRGGETAGEGADRLESLLDLELFPNAHTLLYWEGGNGLVDFMQENDPFLAWSPDNPAYPFADGLESKLDEIQSGVERALAAARETGLRVFAATYYFLPMGSLDCDPLLIDILLPAQAANANVYVLRLNDRIRTAASAQGAILVDIAALDGQLRADAANYENCNHLSAAGNAIAAGAFVEAIQAHPR